MIKQVIVIRRDLKMRRGKEIAQGAHAAMAFMSEIIRQCLDPYNHLSPSDLVTPAQKEWLMGRFTKVCVQVPDEETLMKVAEKARINKVDCHVITDAGMTEFDGVPTRTCLAIGPDEADKVDAITGDLKLY